MKRKKSAIEVMAKYCTIWNRPDIFKAWYEQATDPFNTEDMEKLRDAIDDKRIIPYWGDLKEGRSFWRCVFDAIDQSDPSLLPDPLHPQPEPILKWHDPITPETAKEGRYLVDEDEEKYEILFTNGKIWVYDCGKWVSDIQNFKQIYSKFSHVTD